MDQGKRPELQGGGLVRSAGGNKSGLLGRKKDEREKGDERILGSDDFVNEALMKAGEDWKKGKKRKIPLAQLIGKVASHLGLKEASIIIPLCTLPAPLNSEGQRSVFNRGESLSFVYFCLLKRSLPCETYLFFLFNWGVDLSASGGSRYRGPACPVKFRRTA